MRRNEWERFRGLSEDPDEVFVALQSVLGGSSSPGERVARLGSPPQLEVGYSNTRNPVVRSIGPSPDWSKLKDDVGEALESEDRWTTFAMSGYFRDAGSFTSAYLQLRPVDDLRLASWVEPWQGDDTTPGQHQLNALVVDVAYRRAKDPILAARRREMAKIEAANLLTVATLPKLLLPEGPEQWIITTDPNTSTTVNKRAFPGFYHPGLGDHDIRPSTEGLAKATAVEHDRFVTGPLDLPATGELRVIDTLGALHGSLRGMVYTDRRRANRALAWMSDAEHTQNTAIKVACYVAGLEALMPESTGSACPECGQDTYRINAQLKDLMDDYGGTALRKKFRDSIYQVRSRLVHGKRHYRVDEARFSPIQTRFIDGLKVETVSRAVMLNWLLAHGRDPVGQDS